MSPWYPNSSLVGSQPIVYFPAQSGIAMVTTLILLLVITAMGLAIAYIASVQNDLVSAVSDKPLSIEAGEACVDDAIDWLSSSEGRGWLNAAILNKPENLLKSPGGPLLGKTVQGIKRAVYSDCTVSLINARPIENIGGEIGTVNGYSTRTFTYDVLISTTGSVANGISASSKSDLEVVLRFTP